MFRQLLYRKNIDDLDRLDEELMNDDMCLHNIQVMGKTEAEEAFRPWWDSLSDYIL